MNPTTLITYSFWNSFRNCRKACEWRYLREPEHILLLRQPSNVCLLPAVPLKRQRECDRQLL